MIGIGFEIHGCKCAESIGCCIASRGEHAFSPRPARELVRVPHARPT